MADKRTIFRLAIPQNAAALHQSIVQLLASEGYEQITYTKQNTAEVVWCTGDGFFMPQRYIKLDYQPQELIVSAWICVNIITQREGPLEGIYGIVPKRATQKTVDKIARLAQSFMGTAPQQQ